MSFYGVFNYQGAVIGLVCYSHDREVALQALRENPGARMKVFASTHEMFAYLSSRETTYASCRTIGEARLARPSSLEYDERYFQIFLQAIESGDHLRVWLMMLCIPTLLINGLNHPRVYTIRGENALHIAARYGYYEICIYILEAIGSPLYVAWYQGGETSTTHEVTAKLLELFLNSPERVRYETPLHLAAQYGWECVVRVLISYPQCELKPNRSGLYPKDLICTRAPTSRSTPEIRSAIAELVRKNYYVPLIRTESDLEVPYVGEPFTRQKPPSLRHLSTSVLAPVQQMKAFAGPMTYRQALLFAKLWQNPARMSVVACQGDDTDRPGPSRLDLRFLCPASSRVYDKSNVSQSPGHIVRAFRRLNMRNAMERIGCFLAKAQNVKWKEYWSFLDVYCDLSEPDGLRRFEEYLANQATLLFEPSNNAQIAIGGNIRKIENLYAMHALTHVDIDEQQYPLLARWKKYMLFIMNT